MIKPKFLFFLFISSFIFSQNFITEVSFNDILLTEYNCIIEKNISNELFYKPFIQKKYEKKILNIFSKLDYNKYFLLEPVFALRYSSTGFGMYSANNALSTTPSNKTFSF